MSPSDLQAAERVIESDSFLLDVYLMRRVAFTHEEVVKRIFEDNIKPDEEKFKLFNQFKESAH
jgi:hypothetical protein